MNIIVFQILSDLRSKVETLREENKQLKAENKLLKDTLAIERYKRCPLNDSGDRC